ncbi:MAG: DUF1800 family protein [Chthoniobacterales bacterium]
MKISLHRVWLPRSLAGLLLFAGAIGAFAQSPSAVVNLSTRMKVETGDNVLIGGFIIVGSGQKTVVVRALGPSLPVAGALNDPTLELHDAGGRLLASNDNWRSSQEAAITAANLAPADDRESALIATLAPGAYTAIVRGANNTTGVGLVELYDLSNTDPNARFGNLSTRGHVLTGDDVMIGGFIVRGTVAKRMAMRVRGPTLYLNGVPIPGTLSDPTLELYDGNGQRLAENDNWRSTQEAQIEASQLAPTDDREPALIANLAQGNYTAIVRGAAGSTGIALLEMYDLDQPPQADGSTLYLAQLHAQPGVASSGSGFSTLTLAADALSAVITFQYTNLTSPVTGIGIYNADGQFLFDISTALPRPDGSYIWNFSPHGTYTVADIVAAIRAGQLTFLIQTSSHPAGELGGAYNLSTGGQAAPTPTPPPALPGGTPTVTDASRFLEQSTFGPTSAQITQVRTQGFDTWLNNQFNTTPAYLLPYVDASGVTPPTFAVTVDAFWNRALAAPDQLRQRVAFALSELLVVSSNSSGLGNEGTGLAVYYDVLLRDAFTNFRTVLQDVTLNPAMGTFLDMLRNDKANPAIGRIPNENYAREVMQLFTIGLYQLHLDGSLALSSLNLPIETYDQTAIMGNAQVFTGWTWGQPQPAQWYGIPANYRDPMVSVESHHEPAAKTILNGVLLPANQGASADLTQALDTIFNHANVGPFVCQQLIQRLVTSNPSPGYVYRVASVFNDNGQGVRGDMRAVIRAILLDYDARSVAHSSDQGFGHLREPVLRLTSLLRAFNASAPTGNFDINGYSALAQTPMRAPNVFNFFAPDYEAPGVISESHLKSPEFQITTETTVATVANYLRTAINTGLGPSNNLTTLDLTTELSLADDPAGLVDHLSAVLMESAMPAELRTILINTITAIPSSNPTERVRTAIYLIVMSPDYVIQK